MSTCLPSSTYPQVIHRQKLSTGNPQAIHSLAVVYPQQFHKLLNFEKSYAQDIHNFKILKIRAATYPQEINKISTDFKVLLTFY